MDEEILMTQKSLDKLTIEYNRLKNEVMPIIVKRIEEAIKLGDLSENAEYHEAKDDQGMTAARIRDIEYKIHNAKVVEMQKSETVDLGSKITVQDNEGNVKEFELVDQTQANPIEGKISNESPLGSAFMGHKLDDKLEVKLPNITKVYIIKKIS